MRRKRLLSSGLTLSAMAALLWATSASAAPVSYIGGAYQQNFDGLTSTGSVMVIGKGPHDINGMLDVLVTNSGMEGWTMSNFGGTSDNTEFRAQDGSLAGSNGRGIVSFGTDASTDRALGALSTSNQVNRFGLALTNNSGVTYQQVSLGFVGEQWRRGSVDPGNMLTYDYAVTTDPLDTIDTDAIFTSIGSYSSPNTAMPPDTEIGINGNLPANQVPVSEVLSNVNWTPGSTLLLRWTAQDITGQDDGLAIDNLTLRAAVPEPATWATAMLAALSLLGLRLRA